MRIKKSGVEVFIQDFYNLHPVYYQTRREFRSFEKGLSILDCLFNEGIDMTRNILLDKKYLPKWNG